MKTLKLIKNEKRETLTARFVTEAGVIEVVERQRPSNWYYASIYDRNDYLARPRMFVTSNQGESLEENLVNSRMRPAAIWRKGAMQLMQDSGIEFGEISVSWSQNAGCRTCPCSPGFIVRPATYSKMDENSINLRIQDSDGNSASFSRYDIWVTLNGAPMIDEAKVVKAAAPR